MKKIMAASLLCIVLTVLFMMSTAAGQTSGLSELNKPVENIIKDETVYINLGSSGNATETNVVNHIETPADGEYTDYGLYEKIVNLTSSIAPKIYEDQIRWNLKTSEKGFYYQGKLKEANPPYLFEIKYSVNGVETPPEQMAGKSGYCRILFKVAPNTACAEYFRKNYLCQIQSALNLDECAEIEAKGATSVLSGRTKMLSFTVLPDKTGDFEIGFKTDSFSFDGFTASCLPFDAGSIVDIDPDEIKDGINKLTDGSQKLADGTEDLKDGLKKLSSSMSKLSSGAKGIKGGLADFKTGLEGYTGGLTELKNQFDTIKSGMQALNKNAQDMQSGFNSLKGGIKALFAQLTPLAPPELVAQMNALDGQLDTYAQGLSDFAAGISQMSAGMDGFASGLAQLDGAGSDLINGLSSIITGMGTLTDGLSKIAAQTKKLPSQVGELLDGQLELKDGIAEAGDKFDDFETGGGSLQSFVSEKIKPRTVQFFYKTEEIKTKDEKEEQKGETPKSANGFMDKFVNLFKPQE